MNLGDLSEMIALQRYLIREFKRLRMPSNLLFYAIGKEKAYNEMYSIEKNRLELMTDEII